MKGCLCVHHWSQVFLLESVCFWGMRQTEFAKFKLTCLIIKPRIYLSKLWTNLIAFSKLLLFPTRAILLLNQLRHCDVHHLSFVYILYIIYVMFPSSCRACIVYRPAYPLALFAYLFQLKSNSSFSFNFLLCLTLQALCVSVINLSLNLILRFFFFF